MQFPYDMMYQLGNGEAIIGSEASQTMETQASETMQTMAGEAMQTEGT